MKVIKWQNNMLKKANIYQHSQNLLLVFTSENINVDRQSATITRYHIIISKLFRYLK